MIDSLTDDRTTSHPDELAARYQQLWATSAPVDPQGASYNAS